jgi:hypothetical protein
MEKTSTQPTATRDLEAEREALLREVTAIIPADIQAAIALSLAAASKVEQEVITITSEQCTNANTN